MDEPTTQPTRTYHSIDLLKVVAALLVVAIHARPFEGRAYPLYISLFSRMAVPVFFVVSAFFFFRKKPGAPQLKHYIGRMGCLYAFWFVVEAYFTIDSAFFSHEDWGFGKSLAIFIRGFFLNSTFSGSWFVMALMIGIPITYWLSKRISAWAVVAIGAAVYVAIVATTNYYAYLPAGLRHATDVAFKIVGLYHNSFFASLVFCAVGKLIADHEPQIARWSSKATTVALVVCMLGSWMEVAGHKARFDDCYLMLMPTSAAIVIWVLRHEVDWNVPYRLLRNFSTITYFSHFIFVWFLVGKGYFSPIATYFVIVALCVAATLLMTRLSHCFRIITYGY